MLRSSVVLLPLVAAACASQPAPVPAGLAPGVSAAGVSGGPRDSRPPLDPAAPGSSQPGALDASTGAKRHSGTFEDVFLLTGELSAIRSLDIVTPVSEMWQVQIKWLAEDGNEVREGDRVVEFDNTSVLQTIEEKRLGHLQSSINLESRRASIVADAQEKTFNLERARSAAERARVEAAVPQEILSTREWQDKQSALRRAEVALEKARLEVESFEVASKAEIQNLEIAQEKAIREIEAAQRTLETLALKAPRGGIVIISDNWQQERKFQVGDNSWPGVTIASIPDLSAMEVIGYLTDVDEGRIEPGMRARCVLDTYQDRTFQGKIEQVAAVADRKGFRVRVSLEGSSPDLMRPGMSVRVEVVRRSWQHALTVPRHTIQHRDGQTYIETGAEKPVPVTIAACTPTDCVIEPATGEGHHGAH